jgi:hypothetical protein
MEIIAAQSLIQLANHFRGTQVLARPQPKVREAEADLVDLGRRGAPGGVKSIGANLPHPPENTVSASQNRKAERWRHMICPISA